VTPKAEIYAKDLVRDIRSGMDDSALKRKYKLTSRGLQSAFSKLINNRFVAVEEIYGQHRPGQQGIVIIDDMGLIQRHFLKLRPLSSNPGGRESRGKGTL
jgi:hypothetical protein